MYEPEERLIHDGLEHGKGSFAQEHLARYKFAFKYCRDKKILDIACGTGYGSFLLADNCNAEVHGADISQKSISIARNSNAHPNIVYKVTDACDLPYTDNLFDIVISFETIEHIENQHKFLSELSRVLKPNGTLVISTPNRKVTRELGIHNKYHKKELTFSELDSLLKGNFQNIDYYGQRHVDAGPCTLKKIVKIINNVPLLGVLRNLLPEKLRHAAGQRIDGLRHDFGICQVQNHGNYLYLVAVAEKLARVS